jgi:hypothetical protein
VANKVFKTDEVELLSGRVLELKPLNIKRTRVFQTELKKYNEALQASMKEGNGETDLTDYFVDMAAICLQAADSDLAGNKEALEEELDIDTIFHILTICAGMNFSDPNLQTAALLAAKE